MKMSVTDQWNDIYLAHAYPFLYARKLRYAFANHWWERFLIAYGMLGLHLIVLVSLTLIIVGGYRTLANCQLFAPTNSSWILGVFATQVCAFSSVLTFSLPSPLNFSLSFTTSSLPSPSSLTFRWCI